MSYIQAITPNPDIVCTPGYCLQYVRQTFGLPARYASATEAWENSPSQHTDLAFPSDVWLPVWFGLDSEPLGHVVLRAPDGSIYSTSDNSSTPHHHPSLSDLLNYYSRAGVPLTYRGWTEDVAGFTVISPADSITYQSESITPLQEEAMAFTPEQEQFILASLTSLVDNVATKKDLPSAGQIAFTEAALRSLVENVATKADLSGVSAAVASAVGAKASTADIEAAVKAGMTAGLKVDVTVNGQ